MPSNGDIFLSAQDVRNNARAFLIVHQEVRSIENAILFAADSGLLDAIVINTYMTQTALGVFQNIIAVNLTTNELTIPNHGFANGDELQFQTTGVLPAPLNTIETFYAMVINSNTIKVAAAYLDVINNNPVDLLNVGSGTHSVRPFLPQQQYYRTWQGTRKDRAQIDHMNGVIAHFTNLGYAIRRRTNPNTGQTFEWCISW